MTPRPSVKRSARLPRPSRRLLPPPQLPRSPRVCESPSTKPSVLSRRLKLRNPMNTRRPRARSVSDSDAPSRRPISHTLPICLEILESVPTVPRLVPLPSLSTPMIPPRPSTSPSYLSSSQRQSSSSRPSEQVSPLSSQPTQRAPTTLCSSKTSPRPLPRI